jgi:hypothetical protein
MRHEILTTLLKTAAYAAKRLCSIENGTGRTTAPLKGIEKLCSIAKYSSLPQFTIACKKKALYQYD